MKSAPRFTIDADAPAGGRVILTGPEYHHMRHVMRLEAGADVLLLGRDGTEYSGQLTGFERGAAVVKIVRTVSNIEGDGRRLILAAGLIKGPRMDFMVEKAAELGAAEFWPLCCVRSTIREPGAERLERWQRLSVAAAKQSLGPRVMRIRPVRMVADIIADVPKDALAVTCAIGATPLAALIRRAEPRAVLIACGPEGDFAPEESEAMARAGFARGGLGRNRLRSETAALAALSLAAGILDELGESGDGA
jgi:16S rRNA (uracil1498-N3)-methyltransferase